MVEHPRDVQCDGAKTTTFPWKEERSTRLRCRLVVDQTVVAQHVQQSRLAGVVQAEEQNLCVLLVKS